MSSCTFESSIRVGLYGSEVAKLEDVNSSSEDSADGIVVVDLGARPGVRVRIRESIVHCRSML